MQQFTDQIGISMTLPTKKTSGDIVASLRLLGSGTVGSISSTHYSLMHAAANEIERLRDPFHGLPTYDADGFLSDKTVDVIRAYIGDPLTWLNFCVKCWDQTRGSVKRWENLTDYGFSFITGGWSCNEHAISQMDRNCVMWKQCWLSSHRGGKFLFRAEKKADGDE